MRMTLTLCLIAGSAFPAAADVLQRPEGCARIATAQYGDCSVSNVFRCKGAAAVFRIEGADADGALSIEARNADHGSLWVDFIRDGATFRIVQSKAHPRDTIRMGRAQDSLVGEFTVFGMTRPISGETVYTYSGAAAYHAGQTFARIDYAGTVSMPYPMPSFVGTGTLLYSDALDLLIEEETRVEAGMETEVTQLARLSLPGDAGFGDETPQFGCGELSWLAPAFQEDPA